MARLQKIRPCHILGQYLKQIPGNSASPADIYLALSTNNQCVENCGERGKKGDLYRLPIWVANLVSESTWNGNHGGAKIITSKLGRKVLDYTLKNPEMLNVFGQVMHSDAEREANQIIVDYLASLETKTEDDLPKPIKLYGDDDMRIIMVALIKQHEGNQASGEKTEASQNESEGLVIEGEVLSVTDEIYPDANVPALTHEDSGESEEEDIAVVNQEEFLELTDDEDGNLVLTDDIEASVPEEQEQIAA